MRRTLFWLLLLSGVAQARLTEVKVWYYPPAGSPALVKHWVGEQLKVDRRFSYSRLGKFRIRVTCGPADALAIVFQDELGTRFDLPDRDRKAANGVKDVYWMVPYNFKTGLARLQIKAGADQTPEMTLGTVTAR